MICNKLLTVLSLGVLGLSSCKKLVEVSAPVTSTNQDIVYKSDGSATSVLTGIYSNLSSGSFADGSSSLSVSLGLAADELSLINGATDLAYSYCYYNSWSANAGGVGGWYYCYPIIYIANNAIENITGSTTLSPNVRNQLLGEAKFMRAFCYSYLASLFGDVPLALTSDYKVNSLLPCTPVDQVWRLVINDLKSADSLLSPVYINASLQQTSERTRPNKWVAVSLLARVYLYTGDYVNAEVQASRVINTSSLYSLNSLDSVFLKNSNEAIWQLQPVIYGINTQAAGFFILPASGPDVQSHPVYIDSFLLKGFEAGDQRRKKWMDSVVANGTAYYYSYKYKHNIYGDTVKEYSMIFRLAEQYLIRAEARAQNSNLQAIDDLNAVRARAGLPNYSGQSNTPSILNAILHERQVELFTEWGHRWFDLKRTNTIDSVMSIVTPKKGGTWKPYLKLFPISNGDILLDPNLTQTPGY